MHYKTTYYSILVKNIKYTTKINEFDHTCPEKIIVKWMDGEALPGAVSRPEISLKFTSFHIDASSFQLQTTNTLCANLQIFAFSFSLTLALHIHSFMLDVFGGLKVDATKVLQSHRSYSQLVFKPVSDNWESFSLSSSAFSILIYMAAFTPFV